jgi:hypothetical protein
VKGGGERAPSGKKGGLLSEQGFEEKVSEPGASHMYPHERSGSMPVQNGTGVGCRFFLHNRSVVQLYSYPSTFSIGTNLPSATLDYRGKESKVEMVEDIFEG